MRTGLTFTHTKDMNFNDYLTPEERAECLKAGFIRKLASAGVRPSDIGIEKSASTLGTAINVTAQALGGGAKGLIGVSLLAGLPLGALVHFLHRSMRKDSKETEKLTALRDTYNSVIEGVKNRTGARDIYGLS